MNKLNKVELKSLLEEEGFKVEEISLKMLVNNLVTPIKPSKMTQLIGIKNAKIVERFETTELIKSEIGGKKLIFSNRENYNRLEQSTALDACVVIFPEEHSKILLISPRKEKLFFQRMIKVNKKWKTFGDKIKDFRFNGNNYHENVEEIGVMAII
ncbi:MAG: hypothetical protein N4A44_00340 [Alphaproteobacteria bacterium]|jgi:uncharacterized membrane protein|nr:hypothetical protein [Alphaproteobacteria bacterium]